MRNWIIRFFVLAIILVGVGQQLLAQSKTSVIKGFVTELDKSPVMYASVVLKNEQNDIIKGVVTDTNGSFNIQGFFVGKYKLEVSFIGYSTIIKQVNCGNTSLVDLGSVIMKEDALTLGDVVVVGKQSEKNVSIEKTRINTSQNMAAATGSVVEVLKSSSSVSIDNNEKISIRGNSNVLVLIDGVPTTLGALSAIPAANTQSIDIITSPDVKYDSEGTGGIINIITKRTDKAGINGTVSANYGFNNKANANLAFNYSKKKWSLALNYNGKYEEDAIKSGLYRFFHKTSNYIEQQIRSDQTAKNQALGATVVYKATNKDEFSLDIKAMSRHLNNLQNFDNSYSTSEGNYQKQRLNDINFNRDAIEGGFGYKRKIDPNKKELSLLAFVSQTKGRRPFFYYEDGQFIQQSLSKGKPLNASLQADYFFKRPKGNIEAGVKISYRSNNIDYNFYDYNFGSEQWIHSAVLSNDLEHKEYIPAVYALYSSNAEKKFSYKIGLRSEYSTANLSSTKEKLDYQRTNLFFSPSVTLNYRLASNQSLTMGLVRRITRPMYPQLSPYINMIDDKTYETGNKDLNPETANKLDLGYSLSGSIINLNANLYLNRAHDYITQISTIYDKDALMLTYINGDVESKTGADISLKIKLARWVNVDISSNTYFGKTSGKFEEVDLGSSGWVNNSNIGVNIMPVKGTEVQLQYFYSTPQHYPQFTTQTIHYMDIAIKQNLYKDKLLLTGLLTDGFNTRKWDIYSDNLIYQLRNNSKNQSRMFWVGIVYKINSFQSKAKKAQEDGDRSILKLGN